MKLNKPIITICIIILLVVNLIFFSFLSIGKEIGKKEVVKDIVEKFDFKEYLLNYELIQNDINNYKYPKEVFDYLDENKIKEVKNKFVDNLFEKRDNLIDDSDIKSIINSSISEYENKTSSDISKLLEKSVNSFSLQLTNDFDSDFIDSYNLVRNISNGVLYYISIIISIVSIALLIIFEKYNGILISSVTFMCYAFFVYYIGQNIFSKSFNQLFKYFDNISLSMNNLHIICFILGFVLLLIYMIDKLKTFLRDVRIKSYRDSWR